MGEDTARTEGDSRTEDIARLLRESGKPSLRFRSAMHDHLSGTDVPGSTPVLTEIEFALVANLGLVIGLFACLFLTHSLPLSLVVGLASGAAFAELILSTQKRAARNATADRG